MASAQETYREMLRSLVASALRSAGLKGSGTRYRLDDEASWARIGFQSSRYNHADSVKFTVNLCVVSKVVWPLVSTRP